MKTLLMAGVLFLSAAISGCSSRGGSAAGGALGGAVVGAGAYEYNANRQKERVEQDYKAGRIGKQEYDIRKDQIRRDSVLQ